MQCDTARFTIHHKNDLIKERKDIIAGGISHEK